jgi:hypothetical protein
MSLFIMSRDSETFTTMKAFKHVFTSPSSVDKEPKATRSGNARIHGMTKVTSGSIAYIAMQVNYYFLTIPLNPFDVHLFP